MDDQYVFSCPECRAEFRVDEAVRRDLRRIGCLRCGTAVCGEDFTPVYPGRSASGHRAESGK